MLLPAITFPNFYGSNGSYSRIVNELIPFSWRLDDEWESDIRTWSPKLDMEETNE
ncbi:hypothetical protein [Halalkalibaculum sp. DA384]|uniref:hypothetical protein n=1 Tax=Halalkalibaculum sp. DA384 TaxID=3373606 RepID=UPI00375519C9